MNEKIKELAISCGWYDNPFGDICVESDFAEKFAELIVQECASLTLDYRNEEHYAGWIEYRDAIKTHFGVDE